MDERLIERIERATRVFRQIDRSPLAQASAAFEPIERAFRAIEAPARRLAALAPAHFHGADVNHEGEPQ